MNAINLSASESRPGIRPYRRFAVGLLAIAIITVAGAFACRTLGRHVVINVTPSLPRGLYWLCPSREPALGSTVTLLPPPSMRQLVSERHYLPPAVPLLKKVTALAGDVVCIVDDSYVVNGVSIGGIARTDRAGRPMPPPFPFCGAVRSGFAFVAGHGSSSLDSRYFGPVPVSTLTVAVPLWTFF